MIFGAIIVAAIGTRNANYFKYGPNETLSFAGIIIDTPEGYAALMIFSILSQACKVYGDEIISPFIINTVMDHKETVVRTYSYSNIIFITQTYYIFSALVSLVQVVAYISQIDVAIVLVLTDSLVSLYTTRVYLGQKTFEASI